MDLTLLDKPVAELATSLMVDELVALDIALDAESEALKRRKATLQAIFARRFEETAKAQLVAKGADTGTATITLNDRTLKVVFAKKVEWDTPKLIAISRDMKPEDARHFIKLEAKVDERKFTAATPEMQARLAPARTLKVQKPKFTFSDSEAE